MANQTPFSKLYDVEVVGGDQRTRLAEMLRAAGQNQPQGQMVSGWYVPPSWSQNLNTALSGALGTYMGVKMDDERNKQLADLMRKRKEGVEVEPIPAVQNFNGMQTMAEGQTPMQQRAPQNELERLTQRPQSVEMSQASPAIMQQQPQQRFRPMTQDELDENMMQMYRADPRTASLLSNMETSRAARAEAKALKEEQRAWQSEENKLNRQAREDQIRMMASLRPAPQEPLVAVMGKDGNPIMLPRGQAVGMTPFNAQTSGTGAGTPVGRQREANEAVDIVLKAAPLVRQSTGSGTGAAVDWTGRMLFGASPKGADVAAQLKVLGGQLVSKMPKMSGPQSDKDVQLYKEMAGQLGDPTVPHSQKEAALQTIYDINAKYAGLPEQTLSFDGKSVMPGVGTSSNW